MEADLITDVAASSDIGKWSIGDAGFITLEVFNRNDKSATFDHLTKLLGSPDQPAKDQTQRSRTPSTTIEMVSWTLNELTLRKAFTDPAKTFQIDLDLLLPIYENVRVFLIDNPTVPYVLLAFRVLLFFEKLEPTSVKDPIKSQLRRLSLPFRLFVEKLGGLSSQSVSWSPHAANITWVGVKVDGSRLTKIREVLKRLESLRASGASPEQVGMIGKEILQYQPIDLADPVVEITSHIPAFANIHVIVSQSEQPGLGLYRTLSVTYLTTDGAFLRVYPEMRLFQLPIFPMRIDWIPSTSETMMMWLLSLNIWATSRLDLVTNLDQKAMTFRHSPSLESTPVEIAKVLSDVSIVGTEAAVASGEVSLTKRRASSFLEKLTEKGPTRTEINVSVAPFFLGDLVRFGEDAGIVSSLASMTLESLDSADEQLREIEGEVSAFQRHVSDIANLQSQEASSKLNKRIQFLTLILVILTAVLALSTILQILRR